MKIKRISAGYGRTQNTGDYSGLRFDVEYTAIVGDDEDISKATRLLHDLAKNEVQRHIAADVDSLRQDWPAAPKRGQGW
jgi:hypothetical protein